MYQDHKRAVYRILLEIKSPLRLLVNRPDGHPIDVDSEEYLWTHLLIMETQMDQPKKYKL